jgi:hypothetical protein
LSSRWVDYTRDIRGAEEKAVDKRHYSQRIEILMIPRDFFVVALFAGRHEKNETIKEEKIKK